MARKTITIFGGSGMIGRLIARRYAKAGYFVRVAVRRPNQALFVRTFGEVGQVNPIQANIRDEASVARAVEGADIVVNAVGVLYENKFQKFESVQAEGATNLARLSKAAGVKTFIHISAIGASLDAPSESAKSKAEGEAGVLEHFPEALIVRPSLVFGGENDFFNRFGKIVLWSPIMPVIEAKTEFQPVYADDVAEFIEKAERAGKTGIFELGGDEILSMRAIIDYVVAASRRKRLVFNLPTFLAKIMAWAFQILQIISFGLIKNHVLTPDQLKSLSVDNFVRGKNGLEQMGIVPERYQPIMEPYMEAYRPQGEFEDLVKAKL